MLVFIIRFADEHKDADEKTGKKGNFQRRFDELEYENKDRKQHDDKYTGSYGNDSIFFGIVVDNEIFLCSFHIIKNR